MLTDDSKKSIITKEDFKQLAIDLDSLDELAHFRAEFLIDDDDLIYLDGNSLGRLPKRSAERAAEVVSGEWGKQLIRSWGSNWFEAPKMVGAKIARLVGAVHDEVVVSDSTTNNLFKVVMAALKLQIGRTKIVTDEFNFPSDHYVLQGCAGLLGEQYQILVVNSEDGITIDSDTVDAVLDENTALLVLSHVTFKSGYMYDAAKITELAHRKGVLVVWDLSHSAGSVIIELDQWNADFAVGCTYKYINGGPGSPAFLYVNKKLQDRVLSPIWGWFGDSKPFSFDIRYQPAFGINKFLVGTPAVLSLLTMEPGVDLLLEAGMDKLRKKSIEQTSFLIEGFNRFLHPLGFKLGTPRDASLRGSHVSIRHQEGYRINLSLINDLNVIPDFRDPDNIRLGIAPIYTRYIDIWEAVSRLSQLMQSDLYKKYSLDRQLVT